MRNFRFLHLWCLLILLSGTITVFSQVNTGYSTAQAGKAYLAVPFDQQSPNLLLERGTIMKPSGPVDLIATDAMLSGADYLQYMQADVTEDNAGNGNPDTDPDDGGWDWALSAFEHSSSASPTNIYGATAQGLYYAYLATGDAGYFTALQDAADVMIANSNIRSGADMVFLMKFQDLPAVTGTAYQDAAKDKYDARITNYGSATALAEYIRDLRAGQGYENGIIGWDVGIYSVIAQMLFDRYGGTYDQDADDIAEVLWQDSFNDNPGYFDIIDDQGFDATYTDKNYWWYTLGISGLVDAFQASGNHIGEVPGLLSILSNCQYPNGAYSFSYGANTDDEDWQSTAYTVHSLARVDQSGNQSQIDQACYWLTATQDAASGGWVYGSGNHYPEIGGENTSALYYGASDPAPSLTLENPVPVSCGVYEVDVTVSDFNAIGSLSLTLNFDDAVIGYNDVDLNGAISNASFNVFGGTCILGWFGDPVILADGDVLFTLTFNVLDWGQSTVISWPATPDEANEIAGPNGSPVYPDSFFDVTWNIPDEFSLSESHIDVSCFEGTDGSIDLTVSGGTTPFTFAWTGPNGFTANTEDLLNIGAGLYSVIVTDAAGCSASITDIELIVLDDEDPIISTCPPAFDIDGCTTADITGLVYSESVVLVNETDFIGAGGIASDNCAITYFAYQDVSSGTCPVLVTRTWTLKDGMGNTSTCDQTITILHTTPPDIGVVNGSSSVECYSNVTMPTLPTVTDYCGNAITPSGPYVTSTLSPQIVNNFDNPVTIGDNQATGVWYTDRYAPHDFVSPVLFDGDNRLKQSIDASDFQTSGFYQTQGRKYDLGDATAYMEIKLYIPSDWENTNKRMAGFWGTAFNSGGTVSAYPIIEFTSDNNNPRFRGWESADPGNWHDMGLPSGFVYDSWYTLSITMLPSGEFTYNVGSLSYTTITNAPENSVTIGNVILQGHNYDPNDPIAGVTYDIYWDDFGYEACEGGLIMTWDYEDCAGLSSQWQYDYIIDHITPPTVPNAGASTVACIANVVDPTIEQLDQEQTQSFADWTDCTSIGQSFTTGTSGRLTKIDVQVGNITAAQPFTLYIYEGSGITGTLLYSGTQTLSATGWQSMVIPANEAPYLNIGTQYTFWMSAFPFQSLPVRCNYTNNPGPNYLGGVAMDGCTVGCDPTYTWQEFPDYDLAFKTYMTLTPLVYDVCGTLLPSEFVGTTDSPDPVTCEGTRTYTYTYTDCSGLSSDWNYVYTIQRDDFIMPQNQGSLVECIASATEPTPPTVYDDCGFEITPSGPAIGGTYVDCEGTRTYTWTYTDCANYTHDWVYTYTIDDNTPPIIIDEPDDVIVYVNDGCYATGVVLGTPIADDNCGGIVIFSNDAPTSYGEGETTVTWDATDCAGNSTTFEQIVTVLYNNISGSLTYHNGGQTIGNVTLTLDDGVNTPLTTTTDASLGTYAFSNLCAGTYTITADLSGKPVGGINATDAAMVNYWFTGAWPIEKVRFFAGDVDNNENIVSGDAQQILAYFVTNGSSGFTAGWSYWKSGDVVNANPQAYDPLQVTIGGGDATIDLLAMVNGDFNMSYSGASKDGSVELIQGEKLLTEVGSSIGLPLYANSSMEVGATSLILNYPSDLMEIENVYLQSDPSQPIMFSANAGELRIGWTSLDAIAVSEGEALLTVQVKVLDEPGSEGMTLTLASDPLNELADGSYNVISNASLTVNVLTTIMVGMDELYTSDLRLSNHPNPFNSSTTFTYTLPVSGKVSLEIYNLLGNKVITLVDEMEQVAGQQQVKLESGILQPGVYTANLRLSQDGKMMHKTIKVISK